MKTLSKVACIARIDPGRYAHMLVIDSLWLSVAATILAITMIVLLVTDHNR